MDGFLKDNLDEAIKLVKSDWDMVILVDGIPGSGKSVIGQQMATYVDPTFNIDRITFNHEDFKKSIDKAKPHQSLIYDEAFEGLNSTSAMTTICRSLVSKLAQIRQKQLFVFIILPTFFDLVKTIAIFRSIALIHVYVHNNFQRGFFSFYAVEKKKELFVKGKKFYSYNVRPNFWGRFPKGYTVDEKEYRKRKLAALENYDYFEESQNIYCLQRNAAFRVLKEETKLTYKAMTKLINKYVPIQETAIAKAVQITKELPEEDRSNEENDQ